MMILLFLHWNYLIKQFANFDHHKYTITTWTVIVIILAIFVFITVIEITRCGGVRISPTFENFRYFPAKICIFIKNKCRNLGFKFECYVYFKK